MDTSATCNASSHAAGSYEDVCTRSNVPNPNTQIITASDPSADSAFPAGSNEVARKNVNVNAVSGAARTACCAAEPP